MATGSARKDEEYEKASGDRSFGLEEFRMCCCIDSIPYKWTRLMLPHLNTAPPSLSKPFRASLLALANVDERSEATSSTDDGHAYHSTQVKQPGEASRSPASAQQLFWQQ